MAGLQFGGIGIGKNEALAAAEIEPQIGALLSGMSQNLLEGRKPIAVQPHGIVAAEINDQIAAVAPGEDECIGPTSANQHVVASGAVERLAAGLRR